MYFAKEVVRDKYPRVLYSHGYISLYLCSTCQSAQEMKKVITVSALLVLPVLFALSINSENEITPIPDAGQRLGNAAEGYKYLTTGSLLQSGIPYKYFVRVNRDTSNLLNREGKNATVPYRFNVVQKNGIDIVIPTCMQCHASVFDGKLVIGLGNSGLDFSRSRKAKFNRIKYLVKLSSPANYRVSKDILKSLAESYPHMETEVRGVNVADKMAIILAAHRNPQTLAWSNDELIPIPEEVIPTDVPAWWLLKKKNAMFYNGFARGDMTKYLMLSNMLTVADTLEAREVYRHFGDVLAYIRSLEPPVYPGQINKEEAERGMSVFNEHCSRCHGTYGGNDTYPNLLIPAGIIQTDAMLCKAVGRYGPFIDWFNKSWFAGGTLPVAIVPFEGYVAPPLDGVWMTAPYLHNGSVPTLEALLDSKKRPRYWSRDFEQPVYDYLAVGWKYTIHNSPVSKKTYNTMLKGYSNSGHYFGDVLTDEERNALIEYLKTL